MIQDIQRRLPSYFWWSYDGTPAARQELADRFAQASDPPGLGEATSEYCRVGNPGMILTDVTVGMVLIFEVSGDSRTIRIVADYAEASLATTEWAPT